MKAQVSSEFMVVFSALLMIFVVVFTMYFGGSLNLFQTQGSVASYRNAYAIASAINFAYLAGEGASYNLTISRLGNEENVTVSDFGVTSERPGASASAPLLDADVNTTSIGRGSIVITNKNGGIGIAQ